MFNQKEYDKQRYLDNREEILERTNRYRKNHLEEYKKRGSQWRKDYPEKVKAYRIERMLEKHNLSREDWLRMQEEQDGKCAICGKPFIKSSDVRLDHDHKTGKVRGLLCNECNLGLGFFKDNLKITIKATEYLERSLA